MFISVKPYRATVLHDSDGEHSLMLSCVAHDDFGVLEIGNNHVFGSKKNRPLFSSRRNCESSVRMKRRSSISEIVAANIKLSANKVGELSFCPSTKSGLFTSTSASSLDASLFVDDQLFDNLISALLAGKRLESVTLYLEKEGVLEYGWEPDGSRMKWKTQDSSEVSSVDVTTVSLMYNLFA